MPSHDHTLKDALPAGPARGRGSGINPGNRFETVRLHVLGEYLDEVHAEAPGGTQIKTRILPDRTKSFINPVDSPDLSMKWTVNPYRGCEHGCIYCYARPGHEYLGMSSGLDFETVILAKHDAPALLRRELAKKSWRGETITMSGVTDCYQPIERELGITRRCLEVMVECRQAVGIITKNRLILRDLDLLKRLHEHRAVHVAISITSLENDLASVMEPRASSPRDRLLAVREIASAGIPVTVMTAPIIPGINDREIPALLDAAAASGASSAGWVMLRLPYQIKDLFLEWLQRHFPDRAAKVEAFIREMHGGDLYDARHFVRQRGQGPLAKQIADTFRLFSKKHGLTGRHSALNEEAFRRPTLDGQATLFA
ncbi:MAG: PA0069 family radical SAM protein [Phycisphaeraceae bacterium]|nr:PA0069 family radical SAM protein [Phycisphaeraceae bacterium]